MKFFVFFILPFFLFPREAYTQRRTCATSLYNLNKEQQDSLFKKDRALLEKNIREYGLAERILKIAETEEVFIIPVVVHVIQTTAMPVISQEQILSQIQVLNNDFRRLNADTIFTANQFKPLAADTRIEFCLAERDPFGNHTGGIIRVTSNKSFFKLSEDAYLKSLSYWPSDQYLNLWVADLEKDPFGNDYLGYAQFPGTFSVSGLSSNEGAASTDGVVIDYKAFGTIGTAKAPYHLGRTATHEVGHWLGLFHPWGDIEGNAPNCGTDHVSDTPPANGPNLSGGCTPNTNNCGGVFRTEMAENFMDYSPDKCMNTFTLGQKQRLHLVLQNSPSRNALLSSQGCAFLSSVKNKKEDLVKIFPNPANEYFILNISADEPQNVEGEIYTVLGQKVFSFSEHASGSFQYRVDVSKWMPGFYLIRLTYGNREENLKLWIVK